MYILCRQTSKNCLILYVLTVADMCNITLQIFPFHWFVIKLITSLSVCTASLSMGYKSIRETLTNQCAVILSCYSKHCSKQSPPGQLILPDSLKLLPLYASCLLKSDALLSRELMTEVVGGVVVLFVSCDQTWGQLKL